MNMWEFSSSGSPYLTKLVATSNRIANGNTERTGHQVTVLRCPIITMINDETVTAFSASKCRGALQVFQCRPRLAITDPSNTPRCSCEHRYASLHDNIIGKCNIGPFMGVITYAATAIILMLRPGVPVNKIGEPACFTDNAVDGQR